MPTLREKRFARLDRIERRLVTAPYRIVASATPRELVLETLAGLGWIQTHRPVW